MPAVQPPSSGRSRGMYESQRNQGKAGKQTKDALNSSFSKLKEHPTLKGIVDNGSSIFRSIKEDPELREDVEKLRKVLDNLTVTVAKDENLNIRTDQLVQEWSSMHRKCSDLTAGETLNVLVRRHAARAFIWSVIWRIRHSLEIRTPTTSADEGSCNPANNNEALKKQLCNPYHGALTFSLMVFRYAAPYGPDQYSAFDATFKKITAVYYNEKEYLEHWNVAWEYNAQFKKQASVWATDKVELSPQMKDQLNNFFPVWKRDVSVLTTEPTHETTGDRNDLVPGKAGEYLRTSTTSFTKFVSEAEKLDRPTTSGNGPRQPLKTPVRSPSQPGRDQVSRTHKNDSSDEDSYCCF